MKSDPRPTKEPDADLHPHSRSDGTPTARSGPRDPPSEASEKKGFSLNPFVHGTARSITDVAGPINCRAWVGSISLRHDGSNCQVVLFPPHMCGSVTRRREKHVIRRLGFALAVLALVSGAGLLLRAEPPQAVGTWASIGTAPENRIGAAAVALPDGRTLIAGGLAIGTPTDAVVVFDPADSSFATAGQLLEPRAGHTATLLEDGRVLIAGGKVNDILTGDLEIFDPSDGSSTLVATLAMLRSGHAAARIGDGKVLIAGGTGTDGVLQTAEIFDPETGSVSLTGSALNIARAGASATTLIDGRVLIAGGNGGSQDLLTAEIYNPSTDSFQPTDTNLDAPRSNHTAVLLPYNNSVLIAAARPKVRRSRQRICSCPRSSPIRSRTGWDSLR